MGSVRLGAKEGSMREPTPYDKAIGERAAHIRNVLSLSMSEVAARLNVTRQTLSNYENGKTPMRADVIRSLCEVYGISPSWLLGIDDELYHKSRKNGRMIELREKSPSIQSPLEER